jgi:hypothetical protein
MNAFAYDDKYAEDDQPRNYLMEALMIAAGTSRLLPEPEHLKALLDEMKKPNPIRVVTGVHE